MVRSSRARRTVILHFATRITACATKPLSFKDPHPATTMPKAKSPFPDTHWSLLGRAAVGDNSGRRPALAEFLGLYLAALQRYLVVGMRIDPDLAQDILQDFFVSKVMAGNLLMAADPARGRFRDLLLKSLRNHAISELRRRKGWTGRIEPAEDLGEFASADTDLGELLQCLWAQQVLTAAVARLEEDCRTRGRDDIWQVFRLRLADPALRGTAPVDYAELVERLRIATPRKAINLLTTGTRMFRRHLEQVVAAYAPAGADLEAELRDLRRILTGKGMTLVWGIPDEH